MADAPTLLVLVHSRGGSSARLADAVEAGARLAHDEVSGGGESGDGSLELVRLDVVEAGSDDVLAAGAVVFVTPARFGALAGLTKDLLERIYPWFEEVPDVRPGMAWTAVVKGATDPSGAVRDLERILTGLRWKQVLPPLQCTGDLDDEDLTGARDVGPTMAAGLLTGMW